MKLVSKGCKISPEELNRLTKKARELGVSDNKLMRIAISNVDKIVAFEEQIQLKATFDRELIAA